MFFLRYVKYGFFSLAFLLPVGLQAALVYPASPHALFADQIDPDELWFGPDSTSRWAATSNLSSFSLLMPNSSALRPSMKLIARSVPKSAVLFPEQFQAQFSLHGWRVTDWERNGSHLFTWESITGGKSRDFYDLVVMVKPVHFTAVPGSQELVTQEVPVPAALWLLGSGLLALFGWARRR